MAYQFASIEKKWQAYWKRHRTFQTPKDRAGPKYYVLDMFPYPSGAGLHVGHPEGYTATDIMARYKRMRGFNVLHPMGWDAFGLPAERYAMKTGIHPSVTTADNINNFRRQLESLGFSYDWEREVDTTDPKYYRWTQWIFLKVFNSWYDPEKNKARPISELPIPADMKSEAERETYRNEKRLAYIAEAPVNYCAELGTVLANEEVGEWVEKGYTVERRPMRQWMLRITAYAERLLDDLRYADWPASTKELQKNWIGRSDGAEVDFALKGLIENLRIFTTRPDTLYGVTYMVVAPEHSIVSKLTTKSQESAVKAYVEAARRKSDLDRTMGADKEKTGVFTGGFAVHPLTGEDIPIWTADYVMMGYGTGAIMAVPAHDERDFAFAKTYSIPIKQVVKPKSGDVPGGAAFTDTGVNIASDILNGLETDAAIAKMIAHLEKTGKGKGRVQYKLRDWLFSRQRYWGEPVPILFDEDGHLIAEDEKNLPLLLPPCEDFQPKETGESPLAKLDTWVNVTRKDGTALRRETNTMPQWAGSCWYYLRFIDPKNDQALVDPTEERYWMGDHGVDLYVGGAEHAVLHLLYARFWHKVLYDYGFVGNVEPFKKLVHQGIILGEDGSKMSKSRGNVVNPDDVVAEFGADAFRLFEMFLGPLEQSKPWSSNGLEGVSRFLSRAWRLFTLDAVPTENLPQSKESEVPDKLDPRVLEEPPADQAREIERLIHKTIRKVTEDIEKMSFNTAISQLMIFVNETLSKKRIGRFGAESFVILLSPFAPHVAEELWALLGRKESIAQAVWPLFDPEKTKDDDVEIVFQVNGRLRGKARMATTASEDEMKSEALADTGVQKAMEGKDARRIIVVKGKLVNVVV